MADWIRKGERITVVSFNRHFDYADSPGSGFGFSVNGDGSLIEDEYVDSWMPNYLACVSGEVDGRAVIDRGVQRWEHNYWEPGELRCVCGATLVIEMLMTNTCDRCGRDYNHAGQLLAPREQWGEDTGESVSDILMADTRLT